MAVKAKFYCSGLIPQNDGAVTVNMHAVTGAGNEDWQKMTPAGQLTLLISSDSKAGEYFEQGKVYNVEIATDR